MWNILVVHFSNEMFEWECGIYFTVSLFLFPVKGDKDGQIRQFND
jgi:hypothetical protein